MDFDFGGWELSTRLSMENNTPTGKAMRMLLLTSHVKALLHRDGKFQLKLQAFS